MAHPDFSRRIVDLRNLVFSGSRDARSAEKVWLETAKSHLIATIPLLVDQSQGFVFIAQR